MGQFDTSSLEIPRQTVSDTYAGACTKAISTLLDALCQMTGLGFAAVAQVRGLSGTVCSVCDKINLGIRIGDQFPLESALCIESRQTGEPIVIDCASEDSRYRSHPAPKTYKFESYISVPIVLSDGNYFGNLSAVDPSPALVSAPTITNTLKTFASLIAFQLPSEHMVEQAASLQPSLELTSKNTEEGVIDQDWHPSVDPRNGDALGSVLMHRVGELRSHLGRFDMYALALERWLKGKTSSDPLTEKLTVSTRGTWILRQLGMLDYQKTILEEFEVIYVQLSSVLVRQEITARNPAVIPALRSSGPSSYPKHAGERDWYDHLNASDDEMHKAIEAMDRDIVSVAALYLRLAAFARRLSLS